MEPFTLIRSRIIPLNLSDVDTDLILPAQFLTSTSRDGYGENLFRRLKDNDPDFIFNQAKFQGAAVMVAGSNFGGGSSREHAVWAITGAGIRAVIATSFADIFYSNSAKNGLLLITLPENVVNEMLQQGASGSYEVEINLEAQRVQLPDGRSFQFSYDPFRKFCLLRGLDDLDYLLDCQADIAAYRKERESRRFFSTVKTEE